MRASLATALWLLQLAPGAQRDREAKAAFQPFQRAVLFGSASSGSVSTGAVCVALDATVFAHAADPSARDLRLYRVDAQQQAEVPYTVTESSAEPGDTESAEVSREQVHGDTVELDLHMPDRAFSTIDLQTGMKDFIAVARVSGSETPGAPARELGTVTLFDFSSEGLPGSTELRLGESHLAWVHLKVHFLNATGGRFTRPMHPPVFSGAEVPPSRQAQVLYTAVDETQLLRPDTQGAVAELKVAAHVPVERLRVELNPEFRADFRGRAEIKAWPEGAAASTDADTDVADLGRVDRPDPGPGAPAIHFQQLSVPLALGANLRSPATLSVRLRGRVRSGAPMAASAWHAVLLEMRERELCFGATAGAEYMLRYGDGLLSAPAYPHAGDFVANSHEAAARLGPEERNPDYQQRGKADSFLRRNPEWAWLVLVGVIALVGVLVTARLRRQGETC